jgi:hypothetical protein
MNRAESPYDRIVDIPTRASEKDMKSGERVVLCSLAFDDRGGRDSGSYGRKRWDGREGWYG